MADEKLEQTGAQGPEEKVVTFADLADGVEEVVTPRVADASVDDSPAGGSAPAGSYRQDPIATFADVADADATGGPRIEEVPGDEPLADQASTTPAAGAVKPTAAESASAPSINEIGVVDDLTRERERKAAIAASAALPRVTVGDKADDSVNLNAQICRDLADEAGVTQDIEAWFAAGMTDSEVEAELNARLSPADGEELASFVVAVRATLGIPSVANAQGQAAFESWRATRDERIAAAADSMETDASREDHNRAPAANEGDASSIRARAMPPANESDAHTVSGNPESPVDNPTQERLRKIRESDRKKVEELLKRNGPADIDVKPAPGMGKPLAKQDKAGENTVRPKPVFEKAGYEVPKSVSDRYVAFEGKFLDRKSEAVHFEDKGRSLATASEDREVVAHMVAVARAKHWGELQLKGTEEFRRQAWIAAELAGVPTRGFKPKEQDRAMLQAAREAMRIAPGDKSADGDAERTNQMEHVAAGGKEPERPGLAPKSAAPGNEPPKPGVPPPSPGGTSPQPNQRETEPPAAQPSKTAPGVTAGVLFEHGPAKFNHDPKQNDSYYATVRTESGDHTVWGLDLERAIGESGVQVGQRIELEKGGSKAVTAQQRQFDENGKELAPKPVTSRRNEWTVYSPDVPDLPTREQRQMIERVRRELDEERRLKEARERFLKGDFQYTKEERARIDAAGERAKEQLALRERAREEQATLGAARERIKEQAARQVMEDEIKGLPEQQKEKLRGEFESAVAAARAENRPLNVPMPQVTETTIEAVREQIERERSKQGLGQPQQSMEHAHEQPTQEAEHGAPTLEIDP
ncbi:LPD7 domain-containing protein [Trinickia symbiotica]|uniref:LPD7 domain-containing protein n=1 Tax=Trinickia symbiotica TaxID=863227 RepID=UPI00035F1FF9|nr:LPD7 domain-containing protein [Trinickia symbiotica]